MKVATLAGVSVEYYTRLERGAISGASPGVLDSIAKALRLDDAERAHLFDLAPRGKPGSQTPASAKCEGLEAPSEPAVGA